MPGYNHHSWCTCGWCFKEGGSRFIATSPPTIVRAWQRSQATSQSYLNPNARCPVCDQPVFFYRAPGGGRVFFDELGPPWPKHPCTDNGARLSVPLQSEALPRRANWIGEGWAPILNLDFGSPHREWMEVRATRTDNGQLLTGFVPSGIAPHSDAPVLGLRPDAKGLGQLAWLDQDGLPISALVVSRPLTVVPPLSIQSASRGDVAAIEQIAILLHASMADPDNVHWPSRLTDTRLALLCEWLEMAGERGSQRARQYLSAIRENLNAISPMHPVLCDEVLTSVPPPSDPRLATDTPNYRAFTREFDEEISAADLIPTSEEAELRQRLENAASNLLNDEKITFGGNTNLKGTLVTMLLDCSGSMRGARAKRVAVLAAVIGDSVIRHGGSLEVLGFTTAAFRGGRSRHKWHASGAPRSPGRLNDLRHVIFKSWDEPWDGAADRLSLMLRDDFLKENIDGEALAWAYRRSLSAPAARRRILVVSDGVPMDDSTCSENPGNYLERHLREVIGAIEGAGVVHLAALGMDFTLDRFYRHSGVWFAEEGQDGFALAWRLIIGDF